MAQLRGCPRVQRFGSPAEEINPIAIRSYTDAARIWLSKPLTTSELGWLRPRAGGRKMRVHNRPARFNPHFRQRLTLFQPTLEALEFIGALEPHLTYVEVSLDWIFTDECEKEAAVTFLWRHLVKKNHRDQGIRFVGRHNAFTRYSGPRSAPNVAVVYSDKASKVTGEDKCVHIDWRINGGAALRRAGVHSVRELLVLDYRQFWQERLKICSISERDLGRMNCNRNNRVKRRGPWVHFYCNDRLPYDFDLKAGSLIIRANQSTQAVIDNYRKLVDVGRCLITHDVQHLLPVRQPPLT